MASNTNVKLFGLTQNHTVVERTNRSPKIVHLYSLRKARTERYYETTRDIAKDETPEGNEHDTNFPEPDADHLAAELRRW